MNKRNEALVAVVDPNGETFEVTQRNASDLIQHRGWKYAHPVMELNDALATSPRDRKPRGEKVTESRKKAAEEKSTAKVEKKPARKNAKKVAAPTDEDDDENVVPYDVAASDLDAELAQLEAEEDSRGNVEE